MGLLDALNLLQTGQLPGVVQQPVQQTAPVPQNDPFSLLRPQPVTIPVQQTNVQQPVQAAPDANPQANQGILAGIAQSLFGGSSQAGQQGEISAPPSSIPQLPQQPDMAAPQPDDANPQKRAAYIQALRGRR